MIHLLYIAILIIIHMTDSQTLILTEDLHLLQLCTIGGRLPIKTYNQKQCDL